MVIVSEKLQATSMYDNKNKNRRTLQIQFLKDWNEFEKKTNI